MVFVPLLAAPSLMLAATVAERRYGAAVAGTIAAAPITLSVIILAVGLELGRDAGAELAAAAAGHVVAQVAFALCFATLVTRRGGAAGLLAGALAFTLVSLLVALVPLPLAIASALPALLLAPTFLKGSGPFMLRGRKKACSERNRSVPLVGAVAAMAMVGAALGTAELAGPAAAGTIGAFPALSATLALVLIRSRGVGAAAAALGGLIGGLRAYLAFCLAVVLAAPAFGVVVAVPLALVACLAVSAALLPSSRSPRPTG
jgi:hypothetical protein